MKTDRSAITVLLADDHDVLCAGLRILLQSDGHIQVVAEVPNGREAVKLFKKLKPEVVVMDIWMPHLNGFEAARRILKAVPSTKILFYSAYGDDRFVKKGMELGAAGYLLKQSSWRMLLDGIREAKKGNIFFSPEIAQRHQKTYKTARHRQGVRKEKKRHLSTRESEVLQLIAEGKANKQIAADLDISIKTVEKHRQNLMEKLNIHDTAGLTRYAISAGIIDVRPSIF